MIAANMKHYDYFTLGAVDEYGQEYIPSINDEPRGQIKMSLYLSSLSTQDNINYKDCNYIALTRANVDDTYIIKNGNELLKVLTVNDAGRMKQVFLKVI
jgi:hypothetical protein